MLVEQVTFLIRTNTIFLIGIGIGMITSAVIGSFELFLISFILMWIGIIGFIVLSWKIKQESENESFND